MHILLIFLVLLITASIVVSFMGQSKEKLLENWLGMASSLMPKTKDWATPMKAWAESSLAHESQLQAWLLALPKDGLQALGEKIAEFCVEMNVDLAWLVNPEAEIDPAAKQHAEEMLTDYCKICLKAVQKQKLQSKAQNA